MLGKSNLLWGIDNIVDGIKDWFQGIVDNISTGITDFFGHLFGGLLKILFSLWTAAASIVDSIQIIFGMLVGTYKVTWQSGSRMGEMADISGNAMTQGLQTNNMILDVFLSEYVLSAFWKILVLSIFLLLIFTIIAIIKNEYSTPADGSGKPEQQNGKMIFIKRAVKSLVGFLCVPLACIFGVIASGYLMQALDAATSITGETLLSNKMFELCAADCNRVRTDYDFYLELSGDENSEGTSAKEDYDVSNGHEKFSEFGGKEREDLAKTIDNYFIYGKELPEGVLFDEGDRFANFIDNGDGMNEDHYFNTKNPAQVFYYYDLAKFEWFIGIATILWMLILMVKLSLGAAVRLYELAILFIISPAILSMSPLDNGEALKNWQKKFIGKTTMVFAPVLALNLYFILVATLIQVDFTASISDALASGFGFAIPSGFAWILQRIYNIMIAIAGLMVCENAMKWLGEIIGAEDMKAAGDQLQKKIANAVMTGAAGKVLLGGGGAIKGALGAAGGALAGATIGSAKGYLSVSIERRASSKTEAALNTQAQAEHDKETQKINDQNFKDDQKALNGLDQMNAEKELNKMGMDSSDLSRASKNASKDIDAEFDKVLKENPDQTATQARQQAIKNIAQKLSMGNQDKADQLEKYLSSSLTSQLAGKVKDQRAKEEAKRLKNLQDKFKENIEKARTMGDQERQQLEADIQKGIESGIITDDTATHMKDNGSKYSMNKATNHYKQRLGGGLVVRSQYTKPKRAVRATKQYGSSIFHTLAAGAKAGKDAGIAASKKADENAKKGK